MNPLLIIGALGVGAYFLMSSKGGSGVANAQQGAANQYAAATDFGGINPLSAADAANAASLGLTPQEYVNGGLQGSASVSGVVGARFDPMSQRWYC